jgi:glycosyltransferase involved in cell wall biosynthesis
MKVSIKPKPAISIVIPLFNKEAYIQKTLKSALGQTFQNFEVIVVNDGSTDNSLRIVSSIVDSRIKIINQDNAGVSATRNRGVECASSDYIAFLDADDQWKPEFLAKVLALRKEFPQARTFASAFEVIRSDRGKVPLKQFPHEKGIINIEQFMELCMKGYRPLCASSVITEKRLLHEVGLFPVEQTRAEDLDTWFRLIRKAPCAFINAPLVIYWMGLPQSTCVCNNDIITSSLVEELEFNITQGNYQGKILARMYDFLAWRQFGNINRLIKSGEKSLAREKIRLAMRSKRFRFQCCKKYLQSFFTMKE